MVAAEVQNLLKKPGKLKILPEKRSRDKYYRYHKDHSHDTEDYFKLKIVIESSSRKDISLSLLVIIDKYGRMPDLLSSSNPSTSSTWY